MEDSPTDRPEPVGVRCLQETVAFLEEEMVVGQLLLNGFGHPREWKVRSREITGETVQDTGRRRFDLRVLALHYEGIERVPFQSAGASYPRGDDVPTFRVQVVESFLLAPRLLGVPVCALKSAVVLFDYGVEQGFEGSVGLWIGGVDADVGVQVYHT